MKKTGLLRPWGADTEIVMQSCWGVHWNQNHSHLGFRMRSRDGTYCSHQLVSQLKSFTAAHYELFLWFVKWWYMWAEIETKHRNQQQFLLLMWFVMPLSIALWNHPHTASAEWHHQHLQSDVMSGQLVLFCINIPTAQHGFCLLIFSAACLVG